MDRALQVELIERLRTHVAAKTVDLGEAGTVAVDRYSSPERLAQERRVLFRRFPLPLVHVSELPASGDLVTHDATGIPILIVRDADGEVRAFINACRHRGSRLVSLDSARGRKGLTCRYHAWSYGLDGRLLHVPQAELFPGLECDRQGLVSLPTRIHAGFVWVVPTRDASLDLPSFLGPLGDELSSFGLAEHRVHRQVSMIRRCNWKLVIDAFLEGYHVRSLHRDTVYQFFYGYGVVFDVLGRHVRSAGARRTLVEAEDTPCEQWDIRRYATVFHYLFPNTVLVFHPDWVSQISMYPDGLDTARYEHRMLIPRAPESDEERTHWDRTFDLIEGTVFQKEDLEIAESIQATIGSGADETFTIGRLEHAILHFHRTLDDALRDA